MTKIKFYQTLVASFVAILFSISSAVATDTTPEGGEGDEAASSATAEAIELTVDYGRILTEMGGYDASGHANFRTTADDNGVIFWVKRSGDEDEFFACLKKNATGGAITTDMTAAAYSDEALKAALTGFGTQEIDGVSYTLVVENADDEAAPGDAPEVDDTAPADE